MTSALRQVEAGPVDELVDQLREPLGCDEWRDIYEFRHSALKDVVEAWQRLPANSAEWNAISILLEPNDGMTQFASAAARLLSAADVVMESGPGEMCGVDYSLVRDMERAHAELGRLIDQWKDS
jgi:hypothetical protein